MENRSELALLRLVKAINLVEERNPIFSTDGCVLTDAISNSLGGGMDLFELVLTGLGAPEDNSHKYKSGDPLLFCRDFLNDWLFNYLEDGSTPEQALAEFISMKSEWEKTYGTH